MKPALLAYSPPDRTPRLSQIILGRGTFAEYSPPVISSRRRCRGLKTQAGNRRLRRWTRRREKGQKKVPEAQRHKNTTMLRRGGGEETRALRKAVLLRVNIVIIVPTCHIIGVHCLKSRRNNEGQKRRIGDLAGKPQRNRSGSRVSYFPGFVPGPLSGF